MDYESSGQNISSIGHSVPQRDDFKGHFHAYIYICVGQGTAPSYWNPNLSLILSYIAKYI